MKKWQCTVCGYIHEGDTPPELCPLCGETKDKFVEIVDTEQTSSYTQQNQRNYYKCDICGNLIGMINDSGVTPQCCGESMKKLVPNTVDASNEKHLPIIKRSKNGVSVSVGSTIHPMTPEHYIQWIALAQGNSTQRVALSPSDRPEIDFNCTPDPVTVYSFCNLHGLWSSEA